MAEADVVKTVVTQRVETDPSNGLPNAPVEVVTMPWWKIMLVRGARVYVFALIGALSLAGISVVASDNPSAVVSFDTFLATMKVAGLGSLVPAFVGMLVNAGELLMRLDQTKPQLRA